MMQAGSSVAVSAAADILGLTEDEVRALVVVGTLHGWREGSAQQYERVAMDSVLVYQAWQLRQKGA